MSLISRPQAPRSFAGVAGTLAVLFGLGLILAQGFGLPRDAEDASRLPPPAAAAALDADSDLHADIDQAGAAGLGLDCRLVAAPLQSSAELGDERIEASARIQNAGLDPLSIHALQLSWRGDFRLQSLSVGGMQTDAENAASPAVVPLSNPTGYSIEPGAEALVTLIFEAQADEAVWSPGPIILLTREGCQVALLPAPKPSLSCLLDATGPWRVPDSPEALAFELRAEESNAAGQLNLIELDWPTEENGALTELRIESGDGSGQLGKLSVVDLNPRKRSPTLIRVGKLLGDEELEPARARRLIFGFQNSAAGGPYVMTASTGQSCRATASTWLADPGCGVSLRRLKLERRSASMQISNARGITQSLQALQLLWNRGSHGKLLQVQAGGRTVWQEGAEASPATIAFRSALVIPPGGNLELSLIFDGLAVADPIDPVDPAPLPLPVSPLLADIRSDIPGQAVNSGDFAVVASLASGCSAALTSLDQGEALNCRVSASELTRSTDVSEEAEPAVSARLENSGGAARLARMTINWPVHNGKLTGVFLGRQSLLSQPQFHSREAFQLLTPDAALLRQGEPQLLKLTFEHAPARLGYGITLRFEDAAGQPCSDLVLSSPGIAPDCRLSLTDYIFNQDQIELSLNSGGSDPLEIESVRVDWPNNGGADLTRLQRLSLVDHDAEVSLMPTGAQEPPVHARPADAGAVPAIVPPGLDPPKRLQLSFDNVRDPAAMEKGLKVTVYFVEGCKVGFADEGNATVPEHYEFEAEISALPELGIMGYWEVEEVQDRNMLWAIEVSPATRFEPSIFRPHVGDRIVVEAHRIDDRMLAQRIRFVLGQSERGFVGPITRINPVLPPALPRWIEVGGEEAGELGGQRVEIIQGFTAIDRPDDLVMGSVVAVKGFHDGDRGFIGSRVDVVEAQSDEPFPLAFKAIIQQVREPEEDAPFEQISRVLSAGGYEVYVPQRVARGLTFQPGRTARIEGEAHGLQVLAVSVEIEQAQEASARSSIRRVEGPILQLPPSGLLGTWAVDVGAAEPYTFTLSSLAALDTRIAPAEIGGRVEARVKEMPGGSRFALSARTRWP